MKKTRQAVFGAALVLVLIAIGSLAFAASPSYSTFTELSTSYRGVAGTWTGEEWSVPCSSSSTQTNHINEALWATGDLTTGGVRAWVEIGHRKEARLCVRDSFLYWIRVYQGSSGQVDGADGVITGVGGATQQLRYALIRQTNGCQSGVTWCWHFRLDSGSGGVTYHTCCGNKPHLAAPEEVRSGLECQYPSGGTCPITGGPVTVTDLTYKDTGEVWRSWAGMDDDCVEYTESMRGKWLSAISVRYSANVNITGTITTCL